MKNLNEFVLKILEDKKNCDKNEISKEKVLVLNKYMLKT